MPRKRKQQDLVESMQDVTRGSTSKGWLDQPAAAQCREELRRYLALCVAGEMVLNLRALTRLHVNKKRGIPISESAVKNWMDKDSICGPLREHINSCGDIPLDAELMKYVEESVRWKESQ